MEIRTQGTGQPNRYIFHAVEGFGKTSFGAQMPEAGIHHDEGGDGTPHPP